MVWVLTCDDVVLCQRLGMLLFHLALHYAKFGAPEKKKVPKQEHVSDTFPAISLKKKNERTETEPQERNYMLKTPGVTICFT